MTLGEREYIVKSEESVQLIGELREDSAGEQTVSEQVQDNFHFRKLSRRIPKRKRMPLALGRPLELETP